MCFSGRRWKCVRKTLCFMRKTLNLLENRSILNFFLGINVFHKNTTSFEHISHVFHKNTTSLQQISNVFQKNTRFSFENHPHALSYGLRTYFASQDSHFNIQLVRTANPSQYLTRDFFAPLSPICKVDLHVERDQRKNRNPACVSTLPFWGERIRKPGQQKSLVKY